MDTVSITSSDALLANIGGPDSNEMLQKMELEAVQKKLKGKFQLTTIRMWYKYIIMCLFRLFSDEEEKAKRLGDEAAILRREKAKLISKFFNI